MILAANKFPTFLFLLFLVVGGCSKSTWVKLSGKTMGTTYTIKYHHTGHQLDSKAVSKRVEEVLVEVNNLASTYQKDSLISKFNQAPSEMAFKVTDEFFKLVKNSLEISEKSFGYYDPTVGPLVNLWGFGPQGPTGKPSADQLKKVLSQVGTDKLILDVENKTILKKVSGMYLDLSSSAKGYGVDRVGSLLDELGLRDWMVEIGGEIKTKGDGPEGIWKLAIETPSENGRSVHRVVKVSSLALATSGNYRNFFNEGGVKYSHTIDPKTGIPVAHRLASVTVIHPTSCEIADAWATALNVLGEEKALELANKEDLGAYFIIQDRQSPTGFVVKTSKTWDSWQLQSF